MRVQGSQSKSALAGLASLAVVGIASVGNVASAATVEACGDSVCYQWDDSQPALDLFGAPLLIGDDLLFIPGNPVPFRAESLDGAGSADVNATLVISRVYTIGGQDIASITVLESGDWEVNQGGSVMTDLFLQGVSLADVTDISTASSAVDGSGDSGGLQLWDTEAMITPFTDFAGAANELSLTLQNTLAATTGGSGDRAFIEKKYVAVVTSVVPVPPAVWLFGSALGLLGWVRRRSN